MMLPTAESVGYWRKPLLMVMPDDDVDLALQVAADVIDRARMAERAGRIFDLHAIMSSCNTTAELQAGFFNIELRWTEPGADGAKIVRTKRFPILKPK